jgi:hypothetical protein
MANNGETKWPHGDGSRRGDELVLSGGDDAEAVPKIADFLTRHSVKVVHQSENAVMVEHHGRKFAMAPKLQQDGLDRIVVHEYWAAKPDNPEMAFMRLVNQLNNEYNTGAFYIDRDGDLGYQTQLTFMDKLTWEEVDAFLTWHDYTLFAVLFSHKDELQVYLK